MKVGRNPRLPIQMAAPAIQVVPFPTYLYHAAPKKVAWSIYDNGLELRSGPVGNKYLCMSGKLAGAVTLQHLSSDIVFRVATATLDRTKWECSGAGEAEWRGTETIPSANLEWRRYLGSDQQKTFGTDQTLFGPR